MKCMKHLLFFILFLSAGCAGFQEAERSVNDENIFFSTRAPKVKIKIDPSLRYIGKIKKTDVIDFESYDTGYETHEVFIFGDIGGYNTYKKGTIIILSHLDKHGSYYTTDYFSGVKYKLAHKTVKINKKNYQQCVFPAPFFFRKEIKNVIFDKGYVIPNLFLMKGLTRNVSVNDDKLMQIIYMEEVSSFNPFVSEFMSQNLVSITLHGM